MNTTKKSLWAAGIALLISIALLIGTTFAWFTDSVINKGNVISAGDLKISATAYDVDMSNTSGQSYEIAGVNNGNKIYFEATGQNLKNDSNPIINESLWEPGKSNAKLLTVKNEGSLATKLSLNFDVNGGGLQDALWFDFIQVGSDGNLAGEFTKRPMSELKRLGDNREFSLATGQSISFILVYGMYENAGNDYQGQTFGADVTILAKQDTVEKDGFGSNQYDTGAGYGVSNGNELDNSLEKGGKTKIASDMSLVTAVGLKGDTKSELNLNGNTLTMTSDGIIDLSDNAEITISNGTIEQNFESETGYICRAENNSHVVIENGTYICGLTAVQAGDNAIVEIKGGHFEALAKWNEKYWILNLIDNSNAKIIVTGGTFVNYDPSNSDTENPKMNFVADGYKVVSETHGEDIWYTVVPE